MKNLLLLPLILLLESSYAAPVHPCAAAATKQAERLLEFHVGPDDRIGVDEKIKVLAPIRNPANKNQIFDVLEVWGHVYKGRYRMHLIFARIKPDCLLMGQEILEFAKL
ncbi:hypothetical protein OU994_29315 [Pseudoduganella sp. SL102]|uniref:hypothetical protein n=1 Tax=Pseudoduganella sp. SL102 TaxID=2995154 RepID=UPI00248B9206|nr:hypothetical protein [Pseudoduganella sp. SL102]WBS02297.1 hypothetical protein OU994_29315 [Pseudoduganella sp. SL102]